jgi:hypothetical protein
MESTPDAMSDDEMALLLAPQYPHPYKLIRELVEGANGNEALARVAIAAGFPIGYLLRMGAALHPTPTVLHATLTEDRA